MRGAYLDPRLRGDDEHNLRGGVPFFAVIPGRAQREPGIQWHLRGARLDPRLRGDDVK